MILHVLGMLLGTLGVIWLLCALLTSVAFMVQVMGGW